MKTPCRSSLYTLGTPVVRYVLYRAGPLQDRPLVHIFKLYWRTPDAPHPGSPPSIRFRILNQERKTNRQVLIPCTHTPAQLSRQVRPLASKSEAAHLAVGGPNSGPSADPDLVRAGRRGEREYRTLLISMVSPPMNIIEQKFYFGKSQSQAGRQVCLWTAPWNGSANFITPIFINR